MIIIIGVIIVTVSIIGGFIWGGGHVGALFHPNELLVIAGGAMGGLVIMSPKKVLVDMAKGLVVCLKGAPHNRQAYEELLKVLYELFLLGRRNGMIALEEHVMDPLNSLIFKKYSLFSGNKHAMEFLCGSLRPIIDGKIKPDQLRLLLDVEIDRMEIEHAAPVNVLTKTADAMPGFGIVAAVLGIVITMASIAGPVEQIGTRRGRPCRHFPRNSPLLRLHESIGHEPGIQLRRRTGLHALYRRLRGRLRQWHGAHHRGGTRPTRSQQRTPPLGGGIGRHAQSAENAG